MEPTYSDVQLILTARLSYIDSLPQAQIARMVGVSQSKISRMLSLARQRGLVRISVPEYEPRDQELELKIKEKLGIEPIVIRTAVKLGIDDLRKIVSYFAAPLVSQWIHSNTSVALAGGRTLQVLVENFKPSLKVQNVLVIQTMGNIDSSPGPYDAVELCRRLAHDCNGKLLTLNTPAILPDADTCRLLLGLKEVQKIMDHLAEATLALVGIGTLENSVFVERKVITLAELETVLKAGAVGECLGRFFDASGQECLSPLSDRVVSPRLDVLRRIPMVVAVVAGTDRSEALKAAIQGGLVKALVIDEGGARALLDCIDC